VFAIVFAFMQKIKIFASKDKPDSGKRFNVIVSLAMALLVIIPHVTNSYGKNDPVTIIMNIVPSVAVWIVAILLLWVMLAAFGLELFSGNDGMGGIVQGVVGIVSIIVIAVIFATAAGWAPGNLLASIGLGDPGVQTIVLVVLFTVIVLWFIIGGGDGEKKEGGKGNSDVLETIGKLGKAIAGKPPGKT